MKTRDWLLRGCVAAAAAALVCPTAARAEERSFTWVPQDINRSYLEAYYPVFMAGLGPRPSAEVPGIAAHWLQLALNSEEVRPTAGSGAYRILEITEKRDPNKPTEPPEIDIVIEYSEPTPEGAPPPAIVLIDSATQLEVRDTAEVFRDGGRTLYRVELLPPQAALVPPGRRVYLNPAARYEVQILKGVRDRVAGIRQTLPTFGGEKRHDRDTGRRP